MIGSANITLAAGWTWVHSKLVRGKGVGAVRGLLG